MWKLKKGQPPFEVVDGEMTGTRYVPGKEYKEIPAAEKHRFAKVALPVIKKDKPAKGELKNA